MQVFSRPCQMEDSDGDDCDCEEFAPKKDEPKLCRRCLHKLKHHPELEDAEDKKTQETISSIVMKVGSEHESGIFSRMSQAKCETLAGMRPKKKEVGKSQSKTAAKPTKARATGRSGREPPSAATFKIDAIILIVKGVSQRGGHGRLELADDSVPDRAEIQILVNQGLAARKDGQIDIPLSATHDDIVDIFSVHLPGPMAYFDQLGPSVFTDETTETSVVTPRWVLCTRVKQKLEIVQVARPTGRDLHTHRGPKNVNENRYIFFAPRSPIPSKDRAAWRTVDSLAFAMPRQSESGGSEDEDESSAEVTPKPQKKAKGQKRLSSIAFGISDDDWLSGDESVKKKEGVPIPKRRKANENAWRDHFAMPSIFTDEKLERDAAEAGLFGGSGGRQAPAGSTNAVAGPSRLSNNPTIDLTLRSPTPEFPLFLTGPRPRTPESPTYSDPVEYNYSSGPRPAPKFF
ncbi:hypothetical protein FB451DRAFT_1373553 [Mycena latifolia]|nr:hypothetical protein FB451DRAFT_1373553 [Mycena latifolia]